MQVWFYSKNFLWLFLILLEAAKHKFDDAMIMFNINGSDEKRNAAAGNIKKFGYWNRE